MIYCNYKYAFKEKTKNSPMCDFCLYVCIYLAKKPNIHIPLQLLQPCYRLGFYRKIQTILWDYAGSRVIGSAFMGRFRLFYGTMQAAVLGSAFMGRFRLFCGTMQAALCKMQDSNHVQNVYTPSFTFIGKIQTILWDYAGRVVQDAGFQPCTECLFLSSLHVSPPGTVECSAEYSQCLLVFREKCIIHTEQLCTVQRLKGQ